MPPKRRQPPTRNSQRDPELRYRRDGGFVHYPGTGPNYRGKMNSAPNNSGGKNTATPDIRKAMKAAGASRCLRHTVSVQRQPATAHHLPPRVVRAEGVAAATQAQKKNKPTAVAPLYVGRRCLVLVGEDAEATHYPATVVRHFKKSKEAGVTHLLHFDDGDIEKVGLPDAETIHFLDEEPCVTRCVCVRCVMREPSGRELPV